MMLDRQRYNPQRMALRPGSSFGHYEIVERLGAGGMGEVFRARDPRLRREIAIKVLPAEFVDDRDRLRRFEQEARSASQLNHPHIVTIYEIGESDGIPFIAMELIDGRSLREILVEGVPPLRKMIQIAAQIADGLAAAHERGIVHRDLKPENVMVTRSGHTKILDFGLAKLAPTPQEGEATARRDHTQTGAVLGTLGYMSPEQAGGRVADARSDQFALGSVMYEMVTGNRAFHKATPPETMTAILREDPPPLGERVPLPLRWIVERCLAKDPEERYASTRDLARDLQHLQEVSSDTMMSAIGAPPAPRRRWIVPAVIAAALLMAGVATAIAWRSAHRDLPSFRRVTFRGGAILSARFTPDGQTIVYGAAWEAAPFRIFSTRETNAESVAFSKADADVLSISSSGNVLVSLGRHYANGMVTSGKLAQVPLTGAEAPREMLENVESADWIAGGPSFAVARHVGNQTAIEFPMAKEIYRTAGYVSHLRVSPDGTSVACIDHPVRGDDGGYVVQFDRSGQRRVLAGPFGSAQGLAWRRDGREIWFTAADLGFYSVLRAVTPSGKQRILLRSPSRLVLHDIAGDGRLLVTSEQIRLGTMVLPPGSTVERDLSWLEASWGLDISRDGRKLLITEQGEAYSVYLRGTDGSPATKLADGFGTALSPDERYVLAFNNDFSTNAKIVIVPTGAGTPRVLPLEFDNCLWAGWFPDGKRIYFSAAKRTERPRLYATDLAGSRTDPISPEGVGGGISAKPVTPDGKRIAAAGPDEILRLYPVDGGQPTPLPGVTPREVALRFSDDGRFLYTSRLSPFIYRIDLKAGTHTIWRQLSPSDPAGIILVSPFAITPDGQSYAYTFLRAPADLLVVSGVR